jgi:DNA-binding LacI/PurR family transcriptional regulator
MGKTRITRAEVARKAGVSKTAVTYALAGTPGTHLSPATVKRVLSAARTLGYQPNFAARSLAEGRTNIVGLLLPSQEMQFNLYYARMIAGMLSAAEATSYHFLYLGQDQPRKYRRCLDQGYLDGVVVLQSSTDTSHATMVARRNIPAVTVNFLNQDGLPEVSPDYEGSLVEAHYLLADRGARRIAFLCPRGDCQPNHRMLVRHAELARELGNARELVHVDLDGFPSVAEAWRKTIAGKGFDGFVVDGTLNGIEASRLIAADSERLGTELGLVIFRTGEPATMMPSGVILLESPAEAVGTEAWRIMEKALAGSPVERTTLVPFRRATEITVANT